MVQNTVKDKRGKETKTSLYNHNYGVMKTSPGQLTNGTKYNT